jgi:hypothetical protein
MDVTFSRSRMKVPQLSEFMRLAAVTHAQCWHARRHTPRTLRRTQGRLKNFAHPARRAPFVLIAFSALSVSGREKKKA